MCRKPVTAHGVCLLREFQEGGWRLSPTFVIMGFASADSDHVVPGLPRACKMTDHELLEQIDIPVACPQDWWRMRGDERTRHCKLCGKNVHNLAAMTSAEVVALIKENGGELCGRVTRRADGTVVTADRGRWSGIPRSRQFNIKDMMNLIAVAAAFFAFLRFVIFAPAIRAGAISVRPPRNRAAAQCRRRRTGRRSRARSLS